MKRIKIGASSILMLLAMLLSDSTEVLLLYFGAALLHELGHLLVARLLHVEVEKLTVDFSGVRICLDRCLTSYKKELLVALGGPLASLLCCLAAVSAAKARKIAPQVLFTLAERFLNGDDRSLLGGVGFFALSALLQGAVNFLPVQSFDGGRILSCALAMLLGETTADRACRVLSLCAAFCLWTVALYLMLRVSAGLAVYTFAACIFFGLAGGEGIRS